MLEQAYRPVRKLMRRAAFAWRGRHAAPLLLCCATLGSVSASMPGDALAQGQKRLAQPSTGQPWDGCKQVEGFVVDEAGQYSVQSADCGGSLQVWLLQRPAQASGAPSPLRVVDQLSIRALRAGERFSAGPYCTADEQELRWVAIYRWNKRQRITGQTGGVVAAWLPNLQTGRIEPATRALLKKAVCTANPEE